MSAVIRWSRRVVSVLFVLFALTVLAVGLGARLAPTAGYEVFAIRSGSMLPAMPVGSLAIVTKGARDVAAGEAVAIRLPSGAVLTHRAVEVIDNESGRWLRTKGDANEDSDPNLVPMSAVIGPVRTSVPLLGFVLAMLGMPIGLVALISTAATLICAIWLLEDLEDLEGEEGWEQRQSAVERGRGASMPAARTSNRPR